MLSAAAKRTLRPLHVRRAARRVVAKHVAPAIGKSFDGLAHGVSRVGYPLLPLVIPRFRDVDVVRDVPYLATKSFSHMLDVYRPRGQKGLLPTLFYVHGGGFSTCSKETHRIMAYMLASFGYQVFMVNYRIAPHAYPKPLEDVVAAFHFVLDHGAKYGADLSRLALMGESAGANLVTALAIAASEPRPEPFARTVFDRRPQIRGVLPIYGLLDCTNIERLWSGPGKSERWPFWVKEVLRWTAATYVGADSRSELFELASPLLALERPAPSGARPLPPFFAAVGTADPLLSDSRRLHAAVLARGGEAHLHVFPGEWHAFNAILFRKAAQEKWLRVAEFLEDRIGKRAKPKLDATHASATARP